MCFSSHKNCELKVKLWWVGARERKECIFCNVYFVRREFFKIFVLSQCIVYWTSFQKTPTYTYQKTLFLTLLLLVFKIVESLKCLFKYFISTKLCFHYGLTHFMSRSSHSEVFCKKGVLKNFAKSTGKHLCQSLFLNKVTNWGLQLY